MANTKNWEDPITVLSGIGSARAQAFHRLGVLSIRDLLFFFPFRFEDLSVRDVSTLTDKEQLQRSVILANDAVAWSSTLPSVTMTLPRSSFLISLI